MKSISFNEKQKINHRINNPFYTALDNKNQPYSINASYAIDLDHDLIKLVNLNAQIETDQNKLFITVADSGLFNQKDNMLNLSGNVQIITFDGATINTHSADLDIKNSKVNSKNKTELKNHSTDLISQNGFTFIEQGKKIYFHGPIKMQIRKTK